MVIKTEDLEVGGEREWNQRGKLGMAGRIYHCIHVLNAFKTHKGDTGYQYKCVFG